MLYMFIIFQVEEEGCEGEARDTFSEDVRQFRINDKQAPYYLPPRVLDKACTCTFLCYY